MNSKRHTHTPGPIDSIGECFYGEYDEVEEDMTKTRGYLLLEENSGDHVAIVMGADAVFSERTKGAAYARLFAVAPEMMSLLELARGTLDALPKYLRVQTEIDNIDAVIAKARGES